MPLCPKCKSEFEGELTTCPKCNYDFNGDTEPDEWVVAGQVVDKTSADFAKETLQSYDIPVAVLSDSGFLGSVGLAMPSLSGQGMNQYQIHVPAHLKEDAVKLLESVLGDKFSVE